MQEYLSESYADIQDLAQQVSWMLMDEDQRDNFMRKVVVPRWGKTTSDGVVMKATAWAKMVGATEEAIRNRYRRLKARSEGVSERSDRTETQKAMGRHARQIARENPETILQDPEAKRAITRELLKPKNKNTTRPRSEPSEKMKEAVDRSENDIAWKTVMVKLAETNDSLNDAIMKLAELDVNDNREELSVVVAQLKHKFEWIQSLLDGKSLHDELEIYLREQN